MTASLFREASTVTIMWDAVIPPKLNALVLNTESLGTVCLKLLLLHWPFQNFTSIGPERRSGYACPENHPLKPVLPDGVHHVGNTGQNGLLIERKPAGGLPHN